MITKIVGAVIVLGVAVSAQTDVALQQTRSLLAAGRLREAAQAASQAIGASQGADPLLWNEYGVVLSQQRKFLAAGSALRRAISAWDAIKGPGSLEATYPIDNLAAIYQETGNYPRAEQCLLGTLATRRRLLGENNVAVARIEQNLAVTYLSQRRLPDADEMFRLARATYEAHPEAFAGLACVLHNTAILRLRQGQPADALRLLRLAVATLDSAPLSDNLPLIRPLWSLGDRLLALRANEEARGVLERACAIAQHRLGPDHPETAEILDHYADALRRCGRRQDAHSAQHQASQIRKSSQRDPLAGAVIDIHDLRSR